VEAGSEAAGTAAATSNVDRNSDLHSIYKFLQLPEVTVVRHKKKTHEEPLVDYSKSIFLTSDEYLQSMEAKADRKKKAKKEARVRKLEAEKRKDARATERIQKEAERA
jgi:hypothetical protein